MRKVSIDEAEEVLLRRFYPHFGDKAGEFIGLTPKQTIKEAQRRGLTQIRAQEERLCIGCLEDTQYRQAGSRMLCRKCYAEEKNTRQYWEGKAQDRPERLMGVRETCRRLLDMQPVREVSLRGLVKTWQEQDGVCKVCGGGLSRRRGDLTRGSLAPRIVGVILVCKGCRDKIVRNDEDLFERALDEAGVLG